MRIILCTAENQLHINRFILFFTPLSHSVCDYFFSHISVERFTLFVLRGHFYLLIATPVCISTFLKFNGRTKSKYNKVPAAAGSLVHLLFIRTRALHTRVYDS